MKWRLLMVFLVVAACATPSPEPGCIPNLCSLMDGRFCEPCDGYDPADVVDPVFRLCPSGGRARLCCDGRGLGCHQLDRDVECDGIVAACHNWIGVNTFDALGVWLREGTCYVEEWKR